MWRRKGDGVGVGPVLCVGGIGTAVKKKKITHPGWVLKNEEEKKKGNNGRPKKKEPTGSRERSKQQKEGRHRGKRNRRTEKRFLF